MLIYLSGPMSGIKNNNKLNFDTIALKLRRIGHKVINPCEIPHINNFRTQDMREWYNSDSDFDSDMYDFYIALSIKLVEYADAIFMVDGWENSYGANAEVNKAIDINIPIFFSLDALRRYE